MSTPTQLNEKSSFEKGIACTMCKEMTQFSQLYKCNMGGHIICYSCFNKLPKSGGAHCPQCNSIFIKIRESHVGLYEGNGKTVTVEQLFHLPADQVSLLLNKSSGTNVTKGIVSSNDEMVKVIKKNHQAVNNIQMQMCKPFKCPHVPCGRTLNSSSLKGHFIYEHPNIQTYLIKRDEELHINSNVSVIEYGMTYCLGLIEIYDEYKVVSRSNDGLYNKIGRKVPVALFWLLVSGSAERNTSRAYASYWLVTDSELPFKCTMAMSSTLNDSSCATFCGVNDIRDDLSVPAVINKMNCLYLSYGSLLNLKGFWGEVDLQIIIH